uniref:Putative secreted protein n=1 Tax=Lutzomyia longipalpis TaxID=7200 RepID=A0A7G3AMF3_LUTLO
MSGLLASVTKFSELRRSSVLFYSFSFLASLCASQCHSSCHGGTDGIALNFTQICAWNSACLAWNRLCFSVLFRIN